MHLIDTELARREANGQPDRVALTGGGYMARCFALQFVTAVKGMKLVAICNRTIDKFPESDSSLMSSGPDMVKPADMAGDCGTWIIKHREKIP